MSLGDPSAKDVALLNQMWARGPPREVLESYPHLRPPISYSCNSCHATIEPSQPRFHCLDCDDFDYCVSCKGDSSKTHAGHVFMRFDNSVEAMDPRAHFRVLFDRESQHAQSADDEGQDIQGADTVQQSPVEIETFSSSCYTPLDVAKEEIRILELLPGRNNQQVACKLTNVPIFGGIKYEALSYTWGTEPENSTIRLNGYNLPVRPGLLEALLALRRREETRFLWIDAICINQSDVHEKSREVQRMRQVYAQASNVVVWLGNSSEDSDVAMDMAAKQSLRIRTERGLNPGWPALDSLIRRRWWSRVWCIQELATAYWSPIVVCGSKMTPWTQLKNCTQRMSDYWASEILADSVNHGLSHYVAFSRHDLTFTGLNSIRSQYTSSVKLGLFDLLCMTLAYQATDPRDKVYALLGLCCSKDRDAIIPDYTKTTREVYFQTTQYLIKESLNCFCFNTNSPCSELFGSKLPSWVSDWSLGASRPPSLWKQAVYFAGQPGPGVCYKPVATRVTDSNTLYVRGTPFENIESVSEIISSDDTWFSNNPTGLYRIIRELERLIAQHWSKRNTSSIYMGTDAIWRTLIADRELPQFSWVSPASDELGRAYGELRKRAWDDLIIKRQRTSEPSTETGPNSGSVDPAQSRSVQDVGIPPGWEQRLSPGGRLYYVNHIAQTTTWTDPRLIMSCIQGLRDSFSKVPKIKSSTEADTGACSQESESETRSRMHSSCHDEADKDDDSECDDDYLEEGDAEKGVSEMIIRAFIYLAKGTLQRRRLFITENGSLGLASEDIRQGDHITIMLGGDMPFVMRDCDQDTMKLKGAEQESENAPQQLISEAYVHGAMDGRMFAVMSKIRIALI
ncbi:hypothetical protein AnigIFM49718_000706 [Aspergillus niger]|nr:hypothetical protein AnigIFM49718_000706 [Aspergillus niger]